MGIKVQPNTLFKSKHTSRDWIFFSLYIFSLLFFWSEDYCVKNGSFIWHLLVIPLVFFVTFFLFLFKLFHICDDRLVIKYPRVLFLKDIEIPFDKIKKVTFRYYSGLGSNSKLIVEMENKTRRFNFWSTQVCDLAKCLREQGVIVEIKGWDCPNFPTSKS